MTLQAFLILPLEQAKFLDFHYRKTLLQPYLAVSISDFWRRWHISLTSWFRDYIYIPLGGNRKGKARKWINTMIVFLVSGLWHGADGHISFGGGINGLFIVLGDMLKPGALKTHTTAAYSA